MKRWYKLFAVLAVCLLSFGSIGYLGIQHFGKAAYADGTFTPIDLGNTFKPVGISDSGIIAGTDYSNPSLHQPVIWQSGSITNLTIPLGSSWAEAKGISPAGEVVGFAAYSNQEHAVKWDSSGSATDLGGPTSSSSCNTNTDNTQANAVNDVGDVAGLCYNQDATRAGYWPSGAPNSFTQLPDINNSDGYSTVLGINHNESMVGFSEIFNPATQLSGETHAVLWQNGIATDIAPSGADFGEAVAINDNDLAVGSVFFLNDVHSHAYVWDLANDKTFDLTALTGHTDAGAYAVNNSGIVVGSIGDTTDGSHAFMWKEGSSLIDLNNLIPANSGWVLEGTFGINNNGQIVGWGRLNGVGGTHNFLLNTSTPSSYRLALAPASQTATIRGGQGLVTATLLDGATSAPASNMKLSFRVESGPNAGMSGTCFPSSCTTDANGQVDWGYFGIAVGVDTVQVWIDTNGNGVPDIGEPQTPATVTWGLPQAQVYVALGDSYSSGEGAPNPNFLPGTDNHRIPNLCHRSTAAYPWLTHNATSNTYPTFVFRACSGAIIKDFFTAKKVGNTYVNQEGNYGEPAQLSWLNKVTTGLVTLTIGGNDVGFHDVMEYCAVRLPFNHRTTCEAKFSQQVDAAIARISAAGSSNNPYTLPYLYKTIKSDAPNATVLVLGYPHLFPINPPKTCATGVPGSTFRQSDMVWLNSEGAKLDDAIRKAAMQVGFTYVDTYNAFNGHELCTKAPHVNRAILDATSPAVKKLVSWSFHPNVAGQKDLAAYLAALLKSWSTV